MRSISREDLIKAEYNLLEKVKVVYKDNIEDIGNNFLGDYEDDLRKYKLKPSMNMSRVNDILEIYELDYELLEDDDTYIIINDDNLYIEDSDFASAVYKWAAKFGGV